MLKNFQIKLLEKLLLCRNVKIHFISNNNTALVQGFPKFPSDLAAYLFLQPVLKSLSAEP